MSMRIDSHYTNTFTEQPIEPAAHSQPFLDLRHLSILQQSESSPTCLESIVSYLKKLITWLINCICCKKTAQETADEIRARLLRDNGNAAIIPKPNLRELPPEVMQKLTTFLPIEDHLTLTEICKSLYGSSRRSLRLRDSLDQERRPGQDQRNYPQRELQQIDHSRLLTINISNDRTLSSAALAAHLRLCINLQTLNAEATQFDGAALASLPVTIQKLNVEACPIPAVAFALHLRRFVNLQVLNVRNTSINGAGLDSVRETVVKLNVALCNDIISEDLERNLRRLHQLQELVVNGTIFFNGTCLGAVSNTLRKLEVSNRNNLKAADFALHIRRLDHLQEVNFLGSSINGEGLANLSSRVQILKISFCKNISARDLALHLKRLDHLQVFVGCGTLLDGDGLNSLTRGLRELDISNCENITTENLITYLGTFENLERFIAKNSSLDGRGLARLAERLQKLDVSFCRHMSAEDFGSYIGRFANLQEANFDSTQMGSAGFASLSGTIRQLNVRGCHNISAHDFAIHLGRFVHLQVLNGRNTHFNGAAFANLPNGIRELILLGCPITSDDLRAHLGRLPNLQQLQVPWDSVPDDLRALLRRTHPNLAIIYGD